MKVYLAKGSALIIHSLRISGTGPFKIHAVVLHCYIRWKRMEEIHYLSGRLAHTLRVGGPVSQVSIVGLRADERAFTYPTHFQHHVKVAGVKSPKGWIISSFFHI